uniref:Retrotransposon gag protein n=1 Tax=Solanum tuberosum TaxID=4113 RepID=M0ZUZ3_SOLTU
MNPPCFTGSSTTEDPENFIEELKKVFEVMHVADTERVELAAYQLKNVAQTWFDQWKEGRAENAPFASLACFEEAFLGHFFPRELKEDKNKRAKTGNESEQQKSNANRSSFQHKQKVPALSSASVPAPRKKCEYNGQNSIAKPAYSQDPGASLSFVTPYVAMNFDVIPKKLSEPFSVSTPVGESIIAERFYLDCPISVNHKSTIANLIELDKVDFDVILVWNGFMPIMPQLIVELE